MRVPAEIAAFAAGIATGGTGNWWVIAATIARAGMGKFRPEELQVAANEWVISATKRDAMDTETAVQTTRPGPAS